MAHRAIRRWSRALGCLILLLAAVSAAAQTPAAPATAASWQFYVIGHMTNTQETADWALAQGANGVEMDLRFDDAGNPARAPAVTRAASAAS